MEEDGWTQVRKRSRRSILEELPEVPGGRVVKIDLTKSQSNITADCYKSDSDSVTQYCHRRCYIGQAISGLKGGLL